MTARKVLLLVEGPHDEAFLSRILLTCYGFKPQLKHKDLDPYWLKTVPTFPYKGDLRQRVPVPMFYTSDSVSLAILGAGGDSGLVNAAADTLACVNTLPTAVGFVLDADKKIAPLDRFAALSKEIQKVGLLPGETPATVGAAKPACGIFVLPDNSTQGTLEVLLRRCAAIAYPAGYEAALKLVESVVEEQYDNDDLQDFKKPAGRDKAIVAAVAAVLKPGKAIQNSISDNRWLSPATLAIAEVVAVRNFLSEIVLGMAPLSTPASV